MVDSYRSDALAAVHETAQDLRDAGIMDKRTMKAFDKLCLARLSDAEIRQHKTWLCQWRKPLEMGDYVSRITSQFARTITEMGIQDDDLARLLASAAFFNQAGLSSLREAWIAGEFGKARGAFAVRLVEENKPDFELCLNENAPDAPERFEATEADLPGRRRGAEYIEDAKKAVLIAPEIENDPVEAWLDRAAQIPESLEKISKKKAKMSYPTGTRLVIYLNIDEYGIRQRETETAFLDTTRCAKDKFKSVWILWKNKAYHIWENGERHRDGTP